LKPYDIHSRATFLGAVCRAAYAQDIKLGKSLLLRHPRAEETFGFVEGVITIWDLAAFSKEVDQCQSKLLDLSIGEVEAEFAALPDSIQNTAKKKGRLAGLRRLSKLFIAIGRTLVLAGIRLPDGNISRGQSMGDSLFEGWAPTFMPKDIDEEKAKRIAERFASMMNWNLMSDIDVYTIIEFLKRVTHSAPGPDGLPYIAWRMAGFEGAQTLFLIYSNMCLGIPPPPEL
jgi:hypothetical protein